MVQKSYTLSLFNGFFDMTFLLQKLNYYSPKNHDIKLEFIFNPIEKSIKNLNIKNAF